MLEYLPSTAFNDGIMSESLKNDDEFSRLIAAEWHEAPSAAAIDQFDPAVRDIFLQALELNQYLQNGELDEEEAHAHLYDLNSAWNQLGQTNGGIYVSGEAFDTFSTDDEISDISTASLTLENTEVFNSLFELGDGGSYEQGLYLSGDLDDEERSFTMELGQINYIDLERPSQEIWEAYLREEYPDIMRAIDQALLTETAHDPLILQRLQAFRLAFENDPKPAARYSRPQIIEWFEEYINQSLAFDTELYRLDVEGLVKRQVRQAGGSTVDEYRFLAQPRTVMAYLEGVCLENDTAQSPENDPNSYRPYIIAHVIGSNRHDGAQEYALPATSIKDIVNLRNGVDLFDS